MKNVILIIAVILFAISNIFAQNVTKGTYTDIRDGEVYPTISFNHSLAGTPQTWMARNLNYKVSDSCWTYNYDKKYRKNLGLLYTWRVAKEVCPEGWHLPSDAEWQTLIDHFWGNIKAASAIKSKEGWKHGNNGDNNSGFNALPAGYWSKNTNSFKGLGKHARFWSSTKSYKSGFAWRRSIHYYYEKVFRYSTDDSFGCSVRCVKD